MTAQNEEQRMGKLERDVTIISVKQDTQMEILTEMRSTLTQQTHILQSFLVLEQKHSALAEDFSDLKKDYSATKGEVVKAVSMMRGVVLAGMVFVSAIVGMGVYMYNDKVDVLNRHESILHEILTAQNR